MTKNFLCLLIIFISLPALLGSEPSSKTHNPLILRWKMLALHSQQEKLSARELIPFFNDPNKDPNGKISTSKIFPNDLTEEYIKNVSGEKKEGHRRILQNFPWNSNSGRDNRNPNGKEQEYQKMFSELNRENYSFSRNRGGHD